jgi:hypothetical protein
VSLAEPLAPELEPALVPVPALVPALALSLSLSLSPSPVVEPALAVAVTLMPVIDAPVSSPLPPPLSPHASRSERGRQSCEVNEEARHAIMSGLSRELARFRKMPAKVAQERRAAGQDGVFRRAGRPRSSCRPAG